MRALNREGDGWVGMDGEGKRIDNREDHIDKHFGDTHTFHPQPGGGVQRHAKGVVGKLFRIQDPKTVRVGNCWMAGRLLAGDLILCVRHSGDCFETYVLVKEFENGLEGIPGSEWGAYGHGDAIESKTQVTADQATALSAGEFVKLSVCDCGCGI